MLSRPPRKNNPLRSADRMILFEETSSPSDVDVIYCQMWDAAHRSHLVHRTPWGRQPWSGIAPWRSTTRLSASPHRAW